MSQPFLQLENLQVARGGKVVLEVPDLKAPAGQIAVVFGENGAGKTTMLMAAAGLLDLKSGRVKLFGRPFHQGRAPAPKSLRQKTAFVFQDPYLFRRSVQKNLTYGLKIRGVAKTQRRERAEAVMQQVGISMMLGGNIHGYTRNITTGIAFETGKGEFALGVALGVVLLVVALVVNLLVGVWQYRGRQEA